MSRLSQNTDANTSPPVGYERAQGGRPSRPPSRSEKRRQPTSKSASSNNSDRYNKTPVKHDCLNKVTNPPTRSQSLPPRPPTRRKLSDVPDQLLQAYQNSSTRARSGGPSSRRDGSSPKLRSARSNRFPKPIPQLPLVMAHFSASVNPNLTREAEQQQSNKSPSSIPTPAPRESKNKKRDTSYKNSVSDHDYLQFSLRITEDIIRNDLYTNKEMRRVFNSHVEANRGRLDMAKMTEQIDNLCKELNIPLDDTEDNNTASRTQIKSTRQLVPSSLNCICGPIFRTPNADLQDCECGSSRCLPFQCVQHGSINNIETVVNKFISSSGTALEENSTSYGPNEDVIETNYYENAESGLLSFQLPLTIIENEMYQSSPVFGDKRHTEIRLRSSLSSVTERTEPTTSTGTLDAKLEASELTIDSNTEFAAPDVLHGCDDLEKLESSQQPSKPSLISGDALSAKLKCSNAESIFEKAHSSSPRGIQAEQESSTSFTSSVVSSTPSQQSPTTVECHGSGNGRNVSPDDESAKSFHSTGKGRIKSSSRARTKNGETPTPSNIICPSPQLQTVTDSPKPQQMLQVKSEPIKSSNRQPIPTPRLSSSANRQSLPLNTQTVPDLPMKKVPSNPLKPSKRETYEKLPIDNNQNSKFEVAQISDIPNIKIRGPNNTEEEFVLLPGPIYVRKSSIVPAKPSKQHHPSRTALETCVETDNMLKYSKDAMSNTDEVLLATVSGRNVPKEPSYDSQCSKNSCKKMNISEQSRTVSNITQSDTSAYSKSYDTILHSIHYSSLAGNLSNASETRSTEPVSQSRLYPEDLLTNLNQPPKTSLLNQGLYGINGDSKLYTTSHPDASSYSYENSIMAQLNDYDLTPQRDSNTVPSNQLLSNSSSKNKPFSFQNQYMIPKSSLISRDSLLLGDEYEINHDYDPSNSSRYDNGLPYAISKFYPNSATQTLSSDWLVPNESPSISISKTDSEIISTQSSNKSEPEKKSRLSWNISEADSNSRSSKNENPDAISVRSSNQSAPDSILSRTLGKAKLETVASQSFNKSESGKKSTPSLNQSEPEIAETAKRESASYQSLDKSEPETFSTWSLRKSDPDNIFLWEPVRIENDVEIEENDQILDEEKTSNQKDVDGEFSQISDEQYKWQKLSKRSTETMVDFVERQFMEQVEKNDNEKEEDSLSKEKEIVIKKLVLIDLKDEKPKSDQRYLEDLKEIGKSESVIQEDEENPQNQIHMSDIELNNSELDMEFDDDEMAPDEGVPSRMPRPSVMLTIEQVTNDLERFRRTEIPPEEYVKTKYNFPVDKPMTPSNKYDVLAETQRRNSEETIKSSVSDLNSKVLPHIDFSESNINILADKDLSSDNTEMDTVCCGLRKVKRKKDSVGVYSDKYNRSLSTPTNFIPNEDLYDIGNGYESIKNVRIDSINEFNVPETLIKRRQTFDFHDNKLASKFVKPDHYDLATVSPHDSEDLLPTLRIPTVTYRHNSVDPPDKSSSVESYGSNVEEIEDPLIEILSPTSKHQSEVSLPQHMETPTKRNSRGSRNIS